MLHIAHIVRNGQVNVVGAAHGAYEEQQGQVEKIAAYEIPMLQAVFYVGAGEDAAAAKEYAAGIIEKMQQMEPILIAGGCFPVEQG